MNSSTKCLMNHLTVITTDKNRTHKNTNTTVIMCTLYKTHHRGYQEQELSSYACSRQILTKDIMVVNYYQHINNYISNQLPSSLCQPHFSPSVSVLPVHAPTTSSHSVNSPLSPSITPSLFHSRLKTYLFHKSFPP